MYFFSIILMIYYNEFGNVYNSREFPINDQWNIQYLISCFRPDSGERRRRRNSPTTGTFNNNTGTTSSDTTSEYPSIDYRDTDAPTTNYDDDDNYYDDVTYDDYRYDGDDFDYYEEDEDEEEQIGVDEISFEKELEFALSYYTMENDDLGFYDRVESGHQFQDFITHCIWKGIDCINNGYVLIWVC